MSNKYLIGAYPGGYALNAKYTGLVIDQSATVGGSGVSANFNTTIANYGAIQAMGPYGVDLTAGGTVINGAANDITALIAGARSGVYASGASAMIANFGTIQGTSFFGAQLTAGGTVTNGSAADTQALIEGSAGVRVAGASAAIANFGTIQGQNGSGVELFAGGTMTNGSAADTTALIGGSRSGVRVSGASGTIANFGTIQGAGNYGVQLAAAGGAVTNGSAIDTSALIAGYSGVFASGAAATIANYGTIQATGRYGVLLGAGGTVINGSTADTTALIEGPSYGVGTSGVATVINYGTIRGNGGAAVQFDSAGDVLVVEAGSVFQGAVFGDGATLDLASGTGTISNRGGTVTVSGSMPITTFTNFGTVDIASGAHFIKALIGAYPGGYALNAKYAGLVIDQSATVGGSGVSANFNTTIANYGTIQAMGPFGVDLAAGGTVTNGSTTGATALIEGARSGVYASGASAAIVNFGTIQGLGANIGGGVELVAGGTVTNGSAADTTALIEDPRVGVYARNASATIANFGTIQGGLVGVELLVAGAVINGSAADTTALIAGYFGVDTFAASTTVTNFGKIQGAGHGYGVDLIAGGTVTNGSAADVTALITGYGGVNSAQGLSATIANYGTIQATGRFGVKMAGGGTLTNGSVTDTTALIQGYSRGVYAQLGSPTIANFGTIQGMTKYADGVVLEATGIVTNGSATDTSALIEGFRDGVLTLFATATIANFGTIQGVGREGVLLAGGGTVTNGSASDSTALIAGSRYGVSTSGVATVINYGTISGKGGTAVRFFSASDVLVVEAGSDFQGGVLGDGGTLGLAGGADTITGLGGSGVLTGGASASFSGFGSYFVDIGASLILAGANTLSAAQTLSFGVASAGVPGQGVTVTGSLINQGTIIGGAGDSARGGTAVILSGLASLTNSGQILGGSGANGPLNGAGDGVDVTGGGGVLNMGTIAAGAGGGFGSGVQLSGGGAVTNGSAADTTALIEGDYSGVVAFGASATIANFGTIQGPGGAVRLFGGGTVTNGSVSDTGALIAGYRGVFVQGAPATVANYGTIHGMEYGVYLGGGGTVTNGSATDAKALIEGGRRGVFIQNPSATIANFGTIHSTAYGVLADGGTVTNGSEADTTALIEGSYDGVFAGASAMIANFGTIQGSRYGVILATVGTLTNGSTKDTTALIEGVFRGVIAQTALATIANFGTIQSVSRYGVALNAGGTVTNGSAADTAALIVGYRDGVYARNASATITNFGTIDATHYGVQNYGVLLAAGGTLTNGGASVGTALITGYKGVHTTGSIGATVINFGTIQGAGGVAVAFNTAQDRVIVESGATFVGGVQGGGGTLELAGGSDTITGLGASGTLTGSASVVGSFGGFGSYQLDAGAALALNGMNTLSATQVLHVAGSLTNYGTIHATRGGSGFGVNLTAGGTVTNGSGADTTALIDAFSYGVVAFGPSAMIANFGTIVGAGGVGAGIRLYAGGVVTNGSATDTTALIGGAFGVFAQYDSATVTNYGTIHAIFGAGVGLGTGGTVTNGSAANTQALIAGDYGGVRAFGSTTIANFGTIQSTSTIYGGVNLTAGGSITNGSATDTTALIEGSGYGVVATGAPTTIANFGTIQGVGASGAGVYLKDGRAVTNGTAGDTAALISGQNGVNASGTAAATLTNYGSIQGIGGVAVQFKASGDRLIAESGSTFIGAIQGGGGTLELANGVGTITGLGGSGTLAGAVTASFSGFGSYVIDAGAAWTLAGTDTLAVGQSLTDNGSLTVSGSVTSAGSIGGAGILVNQASGVIDFTDAATVTLGSITNAGLIEATGTGALTIQSTTITNIGGTIFAGAGSSVTIQSSTVTGGVLSTAAGGTIAIGNGSTMTADGAFANAGTIALASTGTATSLIFDKNTALTGGGTVSLSVNSKNIIEGTKSSVVLTNIDNTIVGSGVLGAGKLTLINGAAGTIDATGTVALTLDTIGHALANAGLLEGTGAGGLIIVATTVSNGATGVISAASGSKVVLRGADIVGGTLKSTGTGKIITSTGVNVLDGTAVTVNNQGSITIADNTALTVQGAIDNSSRITLASTTHAAHLTIGASGVTLSGGGAVTLGANAGNIIGGATAAATLTNIDNRIIGAGFLGNGQMTLINQTKGVIDATGAVALTINTGASTISNAGLIEAAGTGGAIVAGAVSNTGILKAAGGNLTVDGAVSGTGSAQISGGTLDFASTFNENVRFTGSIGTLELTNSQAYTGKITGFSLTGGTSLDLRDIGFVSAGEATFSGTTTSGVLTVTDVNTGATASITLIGNYTGSSFIASSDNNGGTIVVDPAKASAPLTAPAAEPAPLASIHPFVAAMAGLGAVAGPAVTASAHLDSWRPTLLAPRAQIA